MIGDVLSPPGRFGPLHADSPLVGMECRICLALLKEGQVPALVEIGPAGDDEAAKAHAGRAYTAEAAVVHEACVHGEAS